VVDRFGGLDGLVLNAGVMPPGGIAELPAADWDALVAVNLRLPHGSAAAVDVGTLPFDPRIEVRGYEGS
jgi:NAD(P)-dependent dehydrogenase (short-subunit alcohol dehydrogenase family)